MPGLSPGMPGTKEAYGISVVAPDGTVRIPPKAFAHYRFRAGDGAIRLAPELLAAFHLKPGDRLMSVKSTTVALSFTPAEIWQDKFRRRGLVAAAANVDRLAVY